MDIVLLHFVELEHLKKSLLIHDILESDLVKLESLFRHD